MYADMCMKSEGSGVEDVVKCRTPRDCDKLCHPLGEHSHCKKNECVCSYTPPTANSIRS